MKPSGRSASPKRAIGGGPALPANQKHLAASTPVVGAKIGVLDNMSKSDRSLAGHPAQHPVTFGETPRSDCLPAFR
jgi:hypothetical protein